MHFSGSIPALITPFAEGSISRDSLKRLIDWHVDQGSSGLVICGTTGECPTLSHEEHILVIREAVKLVRGRIPVIAGAGSNSTEEAVSLSRAAEQAGADALLHVTGYYNRPTQSQVIEHFRTLDRAVQLPIIVYNIPSRTGQELSVDTIAVLAGLEHVAGVKDSTGNVARVTMERLRINRPFSFLSGDDATSLGYVAQGGHGCISVTANVVPKVCAEMFNALRRGDLARARSLHDNLMPLHVSLFLEPSPAGVKYAMSKLGLCANELRMPLSPATGTARAAIDQALEALGL
jgi:4-hydroxy-tetrahydrodipicolinate synthase